VAGAALVEEPGAGLGIALRPVLASGGERQREGKGKHGKTTHGRHPITSTKQEYSRNDQPRDLSSAQA
jgi:hypothetical protein